MKRKIKGIRTDYLCDKPVCTKYRLYEKKILYYTNSEFLNYFTTLLYLGFPLQKRKS